MTPDDYKDFLAEELIQYEHDPLRFVEHMFPWGEGELDGYTLEDWQREDLDFMGKQLREGAVNRYEAIQMATSSGNGPGKSAFLSWIILWAISTKEDTKGIVTADTATQLATKTWPELGKWYRLFAGKDDYVYTATSLYSADTGHEKTWRFDAIPWNKSRPEAFAGLHNKGRRIVLLFDEASGIDDPIWEVAEGALTDKDTEIIWLAFSNPMRNFGKFYDCFHKLKHRWRTRQIDTRTVRITNKEKIQKWLEDYTENSDWFRIHVKGEFPMRSDRQFFPTHLIEAARQRIFHPESQAGHPKVLSLDSAWTGVDEIDCGLRWGNYFKTAWYQAKNDDDVAIANRLARTEDDEAVDATFIDFAYGTGVYSVGKAMNRKWTLIQFGGEALDKTKYFNKRAEMYALARDWMKAGGGIEDDPRLVEELSGIEEVYRDDGRIQIEKKEDIKERLGFSPGRADALVLTFAGSVKKKSALQMAQQKYKGAEFARPHEYDPYAGLE